MNASILQEPLQRTIDKTAIIEDLEVYFSEITEATFYINQYLQQHKKIEDLPDSLSELIHTIFYRLAVEIKDCISKEKKEILPLYTKGTFNNTHRLSDTIELLKETHFLILKIVQKLRQLLFNFKVKPSNEFKQCINQVFRLENNINKWINSEEDQLFPQLLPVGGKIAHLQTVKA